MSHSRGHSQSLCTGFSRQWGVWWGGVQLGLAAPALLGSHSSRVVLVPSCDAMPVGCFAGKKSLRNNVGERPMGTNKQVSSEA